MSGTTTREPGTTRRAGDTLPRHDGPEPRRTRTAVLSILGSLLLLVGVPVALVLGVGNPLPTEAPSAEWLTADVGPALVIDVLAVLVWIVWVHFVVCFLTEWRALRAGRMPSRVVMGGGSQTLARQLVAGVLLLSGGASIASGLSSLAADPADTSGSTGPSVVQSVEQQVVLEQTPEAAKAEQSTSNQSTKHYDVRPPQGRNHDTLWDIADRTLGDPFRWKEILELNKDRLQPDGRRLVDADLIMPGWQLRLPGDARGAGVQITKSTVPGPAAEVREAGGSRTGAEAGSQSGAQATAETATQDDARGGAEGGAGGADAAATVDPSSTDASNAVEALLLGGGLVLAGVLRALTARRGPFGEPDAAEADLARVARQRRADLVDDALRGLAEQRDSADEAMPEVIFAYVDDEQVVLHLARSTSAPEQPWTASEDGMSWTLRAEDLQTPGTGVAAPYPCLVNVAESHGYDLLVDLEMAPGLVALGGDTTVAREVAMSMAVDLATHRWSDDVRVTMVGFGDELADIAGDRIQRVATLDEALEAASSQAATAGAVADSLGVRGVLSGRLRGAGRELTPSVLLLSGPPTAEQSRQLSRLTSGGRTNIAVVAIGDSPSARWRFVLDTSGHLDAGVLGVRGEARRLTREGQQQLGALLEAAALRKREGESLVGAVPGTASTVGTAAGTRSAGLVPAGAASAAAETVQVASATGEGPIAADLERAAVRVTLLGPVAVAAPGPLDEAKRDLLTEVVAIASLHPDGLHEAVLKASLWPRGVESDVVEARLGEVQAWLGDDAQGRPRLARREDGRWHLADDVVSDYAVLVAAARTTGARELDALLGALATGTGEVFTGTASRYGWFAFAKEARACRVLVATCARRAAGLATGAGDAARAEKALDLGLRLVPAAEVLWRDRLRLVSDVEPGRVSGLVTQMYSTLAERGVRHEPETDALVAEIAPDLEGVVGG